jgi:hypothetical protein
LSAPLAAACSNELSSGFARYDADDRDRQIASGAKSGKLMRLAERAPRDHEAGRSPGRKSLSLMTSTSLSSGTMSGRAGQIR